MSIGYTYDDRGVPCGLGFTAECPMTEAAARHAGEVWLSEWGDAYGQDSVTVSYFDAANEEQIIKVERSDEHDLFALISRRSSAVAGVRMAYVERRILEGESSVGVPNDFGGTTTYHCPSWAREPRKRLIVEWHRFHFRHPNARDKFWRALRYCGTPWSAGTLIR